MNPKPCGKAIPQANTFFNVKNFWSGSQAYLLRLPLGVSMITCTFFSFSREASREGFTILSFFFSPNLSSSGGYVNLMSTSSAGGTACSRSATLSGAAD
jgi:hypothetical protein